MFPKPFPEFWNALEPRDAVWQAQPLDLRRLAVSDKQALQKEKGDFERKINESASWDFKAEWLQRILRDFNTIYHGAEHPCELILPVLNAD